MEIEPLKLKHNVNTIIELIVHDESGNSHSAFFKKPDRKVLAAYMSIVRNDPMKAREILFNACWLEGDDMIKTDDDMFMSAILQIDELIEIRKAELVKH